MQIRSPYSGILVVSVEQVHFYTPSDLIFPSLHKNYPPTYLISLFPVMYLMEKVGRKGDYSNFCLWNLQASLLQLIMWHTLCQWAVSLSLFHLAQYLALSVTPYFPYISFSSFKSFLPEPRHGAMFQVLNILENASCTLSSSPSMM